MKRLICTILALMLALSLSSPALAAEGSDGVKITWLSVPGEPVRYIDELGWLELQKEDQEDYSGYTDTYIDLVTCAVQEYDFVSSFSEGLACVGKRDGRDADGYWKYKWGYINTSGEVVVPLEYDSANNFFEGLARVGKYDAGGNMKYGYINTSGEVVIPLEYDSAYSFSEGLAQVEKNGKYGYVNTSGKVVIPLEYVGATSFSDGMAMVGKIDADLHFKRGYINTSGEVVVSLEYEDVYSFSEGLARVIKVDSDWNWKYGFVNTSGKVAVPPEYDEARDFSEGLACVGKRDGGIMKYGYINTSGEVVVPLEYDNASDFSDGMAMVGKRDADGNRKYGFVNTSGKVVVPLEYDNADSFFEGLALVAKADVDGQWKSGYINTSGEVVIPLKYDDLAFRFHEGLAWVGRRDADGNYKYGYINTSGETVVPLQYDYAYYFSDGLARVGKRGADGNMKYGFVNTKGEVIVPLEYDGAYQVGSSRYCCVKKGDSYGIFENPYASPSYSYSTVGVADAGYTKAVDTAGGEAEKVYKLAEGLYYVIVQDGSGVLVKAVVRDGQEVWTAVESGEPLGQEELDGYVARELSEPNIQVDFERAAQVTNGRELADSVREMLANIDGLTPNDPAKAALTQYIEAGLSTVCSDAIKGRDNVLTLSADSAGALMGDAAAASRELNDILLETGVTLNKEIVPVSRLLWSDVDLNVAIQVVLSQDLAGILLGRVELLLGDGSHLIALDGTSLDALIRDYGGITIQLSKNGEVYTVTFVDSRGEVIDRLNAPVTIGLPAASATGTVMASYAGGSTNWGGQYDASSGILSFDAYYSGTYEVVDNDAQINDIGDMDSETQSAIKFLVSKGFMSADGGNFDPYGAVKRYHFTKSLVGMFFALNNEAVSTFTDVPQDSQYYVYVASGQASNLVTGVSATEFAGERELTIEQMLTLTGRTLQEQRDYAPPQDPETYLGVFADGQTVADWARLHTALSVREGLVTAGGMLTPQASVTRAQAAVILYRLFLKLHAVRPVALPLPETSEDEPVPDTPGTDATEPDTPEPGEKSGIDWTVAILSTVAGASVVAIGVMTFMLVRSKKGKKK